MTTEITDLPIDSEREREITQARAAVLRRAEEQGVKPFTSLEDLPAKRTSRQSLMSTNSCGRLIVNACLA